MKVPALPALVAFGLFPVLLQAGEISGAVDLSSLPRAEKASVKYPGQTGGAKAAPPPAPRAIVFLRGTFPEAAKAETLVVRQRDFQFDPAVLPVRLGTTVAFPNDDSDYHNVFSYSRAKRFDLGRYLKDEAAPTVTFDKAGTVQLFCEIHRHMRGTILVLETPHFTTTDEAGRFRLTGLPAGTYELVAWLSERRQITRAVTLTAAGSLKVDL